MHGTGHGLRIGSALLLLGVATAFCQFPVWAEEGPGERFLNRFYESREQWPDSFKGPYPVYPGVFYDGEFRQLAGVEVNRPYFFQNRVKRFVRSSAEITLLPYPDFYNVAARILIADDGAIEKGQLSALNRPGTQWIPLPELAGGVHRTLATRIALTPEHDLRDAFLALVFHDDEFQSQIVWQQVGDLAAGTTHEIEVVTDPLPRDGRYPHNFILVFTRDGEVVTQRRLEISESLAALSFRWMQSFVSDYATLNSDQALPVFPIHQGAVSYLTMKGRFLAGTVRVRATVDRYGFTRDARVVEISNELLATAAIPMVQRWLFFPRLDGGEAIESEVAIPIRYRARPSR